MRARGDDLLFRLPANPDTVGNPLLPAIHGGVIAGFMELSAALYLLIYSDSASIPKIIDFSIDYLRAGLLRDTYASVNWRQGRRVTNVAITAWQGDRQSPIATARAHSRSNRKALEIIRAAPICMTSAVNAGCTARQAPLQSDRSFEDHECGDSKRNAWLPDRGKATAAPHDPFLVFEQGDLPA